MKTLLIAIVLLVLVWVAWDWSVPQTSEIVKLRPLTERSELPSEDPLESHQRTESERVAAVAAEPDVAFEPLSLRAASAQVPVTVLVQRAESGVLVPGCQVTLQTLNGRRTSALIATTDTGGQCVFPSVEVGEALLTVRRSTQSWPVTVHTEGVNRIVLDLPSAATVHIQVLDPMGAPVEHARIWMSNASMKAMGAFVGKSDARGELELVDVERSRDFFAAHSEFGPSARVSSVAESVVVLELTERGGTLNCRVVDARGMPIDAAEVLVGDPRSGLIRSPEGATVKTPGTRFAQTDLAGEAHFVGLSLGEVQVQARANGYLGAEEYVSIGDEEAAELRLVLSDAASVWGLVSDSAGLPAAGASVWVSAETWSARQLVQTASDGTYCLAGLQPGTLRIGAILTDVGKAAGEVEAFAGELARLDLRLHAGPSLGGLLRAADGSPLEGWRVSIAPPQSPSAWYATTHTDSAGHFAIADCPDRDLVLEVREPNEAIPRASMVVPNVQAGDMNLVITVPDQALARSFVEGLVYDEAGVPLAGAKVSLFDSESHSGPAPAQTDAAGNFRLGPVHAGSYRMVASLEGFAKSELISTELNAAEIRYGIAFQLDRAGRFEVELNAAGVAEIPSGIFVTIRNGDGVDVDSIYLGTPSARSSSLRPGTYNLYVMVGDAVVAQAIQQIKAGEITTWRPTW